MGNTKDWLKFRLWVVPHFPSGIVQCESNANAHKITLCHPTWARRDTAGREKNEGTRDKAFALDFALLSQCITLIGSSMAICQKLSKCASCLWQLNERKNPIGCAFKIDLEDDKNFTLQNRWVAREESKVWALSVVPNYFSLSCPRLAFLMWGDIMYFHMHLHFARSTIPEGNWGTTRSLP